MSETRSSIILIRLARDARRVTGDNRLKARIEVERESLLSLIKIACTRPLCMCDVLLGGSIHAHADDFVVQTSFARNQSFRALA